LADLPEGRDLSAKTASMVETIRSDIARVRRHMADLHRPVSSMSGVQGRSELGTEFKLSLALLGLNLTMRELRSDLAKVRKLNILSAEDRNYLKIRDALLFRARPTEKDLKPQPQPRSDTGPARDGEDAAAKPRKSAEELIRDCNVTLWVARRL